MENSSRRLPPSIDRRGFLRSVAGGTAAIGFVSLLPAGCAADYPEAAGDGVPLRALSAKEYAVARAAAEALLVEVPVDPAAIARDIDRELALVGDPVRGDMKTVLVLIEHLTILGGRIRRFTALETADRLEILRGWGRSRFGLRRAVYQSTRAFVYFYAYARDETRSITG
ncbi:MAG: hypothetical protein ACODAE_07220, partial [Gemmatimonadota bacterium]